MNGAESGFRLAHQCAVFDDIARELLVLAGIDATDASAQDTQRATFAVSAV